MSGFGALAFRKMVGTRTKSPKLYTEEEEVRDESRVHVSVLVHGGWPGSNDLELVDMEAGGEDITAARLAKVSRHGGVPQGSGLWNLGLGVGFSDVRILHRTFPW